MKFATNEERERDPQAGLIPKDLWDFVFRNELQDYLLPIMKAKDSDIDAELMKISSSLTTPQRKMRAWLAIALSHRDLSVQKLADIGMSIRLSAQDFFGVTALYGNLNFLNYLIESLDDREESVQQMIAAQDYRVFRWAARGGRQAVIDRLVYLPQSKVQDIIEANNYEAFIAAARGGHWFVMESLISFATECDFSGASVKDMIAAQDYRALRLAAQSGHRDVINFLLAYPSVFAHAEMHVHEYARYVNPFVTERLSALRAQKSTLVQRNPEAVFDIKDANEVNLLFYVLKNLRRRNEPALRSDILFLLDIPSVSALAHKEGLAFTTLSANGLFEQDQSRADATQANRPTGPD